MRSETEDRENAQMTGPADSNRRAAGWVWWGLAAGFTAVMALAVLWAVQSGSDGKGRNRGPADEAAPGAQPARDIDRTRQP
jgi:hypothetical protein